MVNNEIICTIQIANQMNALRRIFPKSSSMQSSSRSIEFKRCEHFTCSLLLRIDSITNLIANACTAVTWARRMELQLEQKF